VKRKSNINKWWKENFWFPLIIGIILLGASFLFEGTRDAWKQLFNSGHKSPSYRYLSYIRYIDMRDRIPVNNDSMLISPISPVYLSRFLVIEKLSEDLKTIEIPMGTTGHSFEIRCPTHSCTLVRSEDKDSEHWGRKFRRWTANVDIGTERIGEPFTIIIESTVWNGFPNDTLEWYALHAEHGETTTMAIVFSKNKLPKKFKQMYYEGTNKPVEYHDYTRLTSSPDSLVWYWQVFAPNKKYTYELQWNW
jgi:hypothetical protein